MDQDVVKRLPSGVTIATRTSRLLAASREHMGSGASLMFGTLITGVLSWTATTLGARVLGTADFGLLGALLGVTSVVAILLRPLQGAATHAASDAMAASDLAGVRGMAGRALAGTAIGLVVLLLAVLAFISPLRELFHISDGTTVLEFTSVFMVALLYSQVAGGFLLGMQRYPAFAMSSVLDACVRALLMVPFISWFGIAGALASYLFGSVGSSIFAVAKCGGLGWRIPRTLVASDLVRVGASSFLLTLAIAALQNLDLVLLRTHASPDEAGWYAAASTIGNIVFAFSAPFYLPVYPRLMSARAGRTSVTPVLATTLIPVLLIGLGLCAASLLFGTVIIGFVFGQAFAPAGVLLPLLLGKTTALLTLFIFGQYAIVSRRTYAVAICACPAVLALVGIAATRQPATGTATFALVGGLLCTITLLVLLWTGGGLRSRFAPR